MLRISLSHALPPRPRPLTPDEVSRVFGGCIKYYVTCVKHDECCNVNLSEPQPYGCFGGVCSHR